MPSLSELLQEVRSRAEVCLYSGGRVAEVWAAVMEMAHLPLPPCSKYHHIAAETMVIANSSGSNRKEVREMGNTCTLPSLKDWDVGMVLSVPEQHPQHIHLYKPALK